MSYWKNTIILLLESLQESYGINIQTIELFYNPVNVDAVLQEALDSKTWLAEKDDPLTEVLLH